MSKDQIGWSYNPASLILVGEITETLRAQGNVQAQGTSIDASVDSPVRDGVYNIIPQAQVGLMPYSEFVNSSKGFNETSSENSYSGHHPWNLIGATSLDALFYPYTTITDEYRAGKFLPYWTEPASETSGPTSKELNPFNPFNSLSGIKSDGTDTPDQDPWMSGGHNIAMALNYNPKDSGVDGMGGFVGATGVYPNGDGSPVDFYFEKDHWARHTVETTAIRGVGFKSPMVLTGWGYDTAGNPVPSGSGGNFHPEAAWNPHLWKSGPVDLRWNEDKGIWSFISGSPIIRFQIVSADSLNRTALVQLESRPADGNVPNTSLGGTITTVYDPNGCFLNEPAVNFTGRFGFAVWLVYQSSARWEIFSLCCDAGECVA